MRDAGIRVLWVAILLAVLALVFEVGRGLTDRRSPIVPKPGPGELSVRAAIVQFSTRPVAVRGYVFQRERFPPELCEGKLPGHPPRCLGPTILLQGFDVQTLDLRHGKDHGVGVAWTNDPVALYGDLATATMRVRDVLR